ncbi:hypothetical protein [Pseudaestuariivita atlantica]|uniref:Cytochrome P460 domain-containing protein n=1 Tax=Pseudaestuariivita atlantica TaxID=1317121 RepID=A0A0L1JUK7_9RHOB|nr:hypothetical protein [Pseudaestuariivita atlantica]KNG95425.1 hypothetical protein ATO11_02140 [Pseudaestuariivita atlantica]
MHPSLHRLAAASACLIGASTLAQADGHLPDWVTMSDREFAEAHVDMAFSDDLEAQSAVAWMLFARANQQVDTATGQISAWHTWPTDADTFPAPGGTASCAVTPVMRDIPAFVKSKKVLAGKADAQASAAKGGEEVTRSPEGCEYLVNKGLNTKAGVAGYFQDPDAFVDMPIGAVEIKARWAEPGTPTTEGAYSYRGASGEYALVGLHLMVKMAPTPRDMYTSEQPSWFWTTFEFGKNPGLANVRSLVTYNDALPQDAALELLNEAGLDVDTFGLYSPNGTQIRFSDNDGKTGIVLGHSMMEDFAGVNINMKDPGPFPADWTMFNSSCHACHATAAYDTANASFTQMPLVVGRLPKSEMDILATHKPLDFMWPIAFQAK